MYCSPRHIFGGAEGVRSCLHVLRSLDSFSAVPRWSGLVFMISCFSFADSFSAVPWASTRVFMFCAPILVIDITEGVGSRFHVLRPGLVFGDTEGVCSRFHVLRSQTNFSAVLRASVPVFMFCAPELVFGGTDDVRFRFHVLRSRTHFRRCERRRVPFSCFALRTHFWRRVPFSYFALQTQFNILRARTRFRRYRWRHVPFSYFALPDTFSAVRRASGPFFMSCAPRLVFSGSEGVESRFHVLFSRTRFHRYRGRRLPFSSFAHPNSFATLSTASGPVFMYYAPRHVFGGAEGVRSCFHVLCSRTHFRRFRGRRVPFSCFARPYLFSTILRASCPVFMFCAPGLVFGGPEGVCSRFHVLSSLTHFRRYRGRRVPFSCFARPNSFAVVPTVSVAVFMYCAPRHVFVSAEGVRSCFHVLRSQTSFRRFRGRRV
jgi:hypothetical protein